MNLMNYLIILMNSMEIRNELEWYFQRLQRI